MADTHCLFGLEEVILLHLELWVEYVQTELLQEGTLHDLSTCWSRVVEICLLRVKIFSRQSYP